MHRFIQHTSPNRQHIGELIETKQLLEKKCKLNWNFIRRMARPTQQNFDRYNVIDQNFR